MTKTKTITQEERLDLTDRKIKEEMRAYDSHRFSDWCQLFGFDSKKVMEEYYHDIAVNSNEYKKLEEQNACLQSELDKAIHQLKDYEKALKEYANKCNWGTFYGHTKIWHNDIQDRVDGNYIAKTILKKWENK